MDCDGRLGYIGWNVISSGNFKTGVVGKDGGCVCNRPPPPKKLGKTPSIDTDIGFAGSCFDREPTHELQ